MESFPKSQTSNFSIPANSEIKFSIKGNTFRCISATAAFMISFNDGSETIDMQAAQDVTAPDGFYFESVTLKNPSGAAITGKCFIGYGKMSDSALNVLGGTIAVKNETNGVLRSKVTYQCSGVTQAAITNVSSAVGAGNNSGAILCNVGNDIAWINPNAAAVVGQGIPLYPGEKWEHEFVYNVFAICATTTTINVINKITPNWN